MIIVMRDEEEMGRDMSCARAVRCVRIYRERDREKDGEVCSARVMRVCVCVHVHVTPVRL